MLREVFKNLFSTTNTRGRLEYTGVVVGLIAAATLFTTFGLAAYPATFVSYPLFFLALIPQVALWFVVAQRVRDIGWNVPVFLVALFVTSALASYGGVSQDGAFVIVSGPWAAVYAGLLILLAVVPGQAYRNSKVAPASA